MQDDKKTTRREFIQHGITTGFALAVCPTTLAAITTSKDGIVDEMTSIPGGKVRMPAYIASPKGKGPFPTIIVVHEIFGVHAYIQDVCRRFAKEGYIAVAPYLYYREGDVTKLETIDQIREKVVSKVMQENYLFDLDNTVKWLEAKKNVDANRLAITGFCWGGTATWMFANHNSKIKAAVSWYGKVKGEATPGNPVFPIDMVGSLKTPVLGLYGAKDQGIPVADLQAMRMAIKKGTGKQEIIVFPEAEHGFHADYRPSYNEAAATDGWKAALGWFKKNGV